MIIRSLKKEDIPFLVSAKDFGFADAWDERMLESAFESCRFFGFIAEDNSRKLGCITLDKGMDDADIEEVFVLPEVRRKGIAKELILKAIAFLKEQKIDRVLLEVREGNTPARKLYERCGFSEINRRKKYYSDGENAVIYLKEI